MKGDKALSVHIFGKIVASDGKQSSLSSLGVAILSWCKLVPFAVYTKTFIDLN